ncbi:hypothetical protein BGZ76_004917 [Entomortierella beljakovae]|nr:hypothetical protein BGZ76_004917 [Entomortierella beljakovae]
MSSPKQFAENFTAYINGGDFTPPPGLISDQVEFAAPHSPVPLRGVEGYTQTLKFIKSAFSDMKWVPLDVCVDGRKIAVLWQVIGTHDGEFFGIPATGKSVNYHSLCFYYLDDNNVLVKEVGVADLFSLMNQIKK